MKSGKEGDKKQLPKEVQAAKLAQVMEVFDDSLHAELFSARCHDTGEPSSIENAKLFKEDILRRNVKNSTTLNLQGLRFGLNAVIALSNHSGKKKFDKINLADNQISDYGMHAIKSILPGLTYINLASNMASGDGLELILEDLIKNTTLKSLDLGVVEGLSLIHI